MSYNGWKNYETWCVNLWLSNDEGTYNLCRSLAAESRDEAPSDQRVKDGIWPEADAAKFLLSDKLNIRASESLLLRMRPSPRLGSQNGENA